MMSISIEPIHIYGLWNQPSQTNGRSDVLSSDHMNELARSHIRQALPYVSALIESYSLNNRECVFHFCVLIDDYSGIDEESEIEPDVEGAAAIIDATWKEETENVGLRGVRDLMIVSERRLATANVTSQLIEELNAPAAPGAGSRASNRQLSPKTRYKDRVREVRSDTISKVDTRTIYPALGESTRHPDIDLRCAIYSDTDCMRPSCALLAASWQLLRIGWRSTHSDSQEAIVWGSYRRSDLIWSILPVSLISVEHAVRLILSHSGASIKDLMSRMSYIFLSDQMYDRNQVVR